MNTSCHAQLKTKEREEERSKNNDHILLRNEIEILGPHKNQTAKQKLGPKKEKQTIWYKLKLQIQKEKLIETARWMVFEA